MAKVRIEMTGPQTGRVWVDGLEIRHVVALRFAVDVRDKDVGPGLEIVQRVYGDMTIDGVMDVTALDSGSRIYEKA